MILINEIERDLREKEICYHKNSTNRFFKNAYHLKYNKTYGQKKQTYDQPILKSD